MTSQLRQAPHAPALSPLPLLQGSLGEMHLSDLYPEAVWKPIPWNLWVLGFQHDERKTRRGVGNWFGRETQEARGEATSQQERHVHQKDPCHWSQHIQQCPKELYLQSLFDFLCTGRCPRNPDFPNNEALWRYKNFAGVTEKKTKKFQHQAELQGQATIDEEQFMSGMKLIWLDIDIFTSSLVSKMRMLVGNTCEKLAWIFDQSGEWTSWLAAPRDNALDEAEDGSSAAKPALTPGAPTPRPQKSQKPVKEKTIEQLASQARFHSIPEFSYMMMILHTHIYIIFIYTCKIYIYM